MIFVRPVISNIQSCKVHNLCCSSHAKAGLPFLWPSQSANCNWSRSLSESPLDLSRIAIFSFLLICLSPSPLDNSPYEKLRSSLPDRHLLFSLNKQFFSVCPFSCMFVSSRKIRKKSKDRKYEKLRYQNVLLRELLDVPTGCPAPCLPTTTCTHTKYSHST